MFEDHKHWVAGAGSADGVQFNPMFGGELTAETQLGAYGSVINGFPVNSSTADAASNNKTWSAGGETRPRNVALLPCIKAFGAVSIAGMADLAELLTAIADKPTAEAGSNNTKLMTPLRVAEAIDASDKARIVTTPPLALVASGATSAAHGLAEAPKVFGYSLVCTTTDGDWNVGDIMTESSRQVANGNKQNWSDATNVTLRIQGAYIGANNKSAASFNLTLTRWSVILWWAE
jgi:hypothetical protein